MMLCDSCERYMPDVKQYLLKDDLHGNVDIPSNWCDECKAVHTGSGFKYEEASINLPSLEVVQITLTNQDEGIWKNTCFICREDIEGSIEDHIKSEKHQEWKENRYWGKDKWAPV